MAADVGYGKPPRETRFRKGRSGNPRGRPRGSRNFASLLEEALAEPVVITENGRRKRATKLQVIATAGQQSSSRRSPFHSNPDGIH
jgi:hypothetical protein